MKKTLPNLNTGFLKLVGIIMMTLDHVGQLFFPTANWMHILGRIAFPLFAYCLVLGALYTRNIKRYLGRLFLLALISQPLYMLLLDKNLNTVFTLFCGLLLLQCIDNFQSYWWSIPAIFTLEFFIGMDYGFYGLLLICLFYIFRNDSLLSFIFIALGMIVGSYDAHLQIQSQIFALLALPFLYLPVKGDVKIKSVLFYLYYPGHLFLLLMTCLILGHPIH
ncbi:conjugal transfer protein TraX [Aequitasia blattaphilus]|uniref:Conjugal transfer protein TraX n=1 Tax=Aequitasia blattaphilus TaxID=2949332 RepID=A0ABT1EAH5_9FIRM|nr:conjugal transfer protein TraX [Aequitasia blattaphilus]MCP1102807.1 conjugal transfer protein TraX [Aequitasia blattaphilus]MCR8615447.1 conjugal transfer protein TraX [Aequitasia blattaphilus]